MEIEFPEESPTPETQARKQIARRRGLEGSLVSFVVVSGLLVAIWAVSGGGSFWPAWLMAVLLLAAVLRSFRRRPVSRAEFDREIRRISSGDKSTVLGNDSTGLPPDKT